MIDKTFAFVQSSPLLFQLFLQESPAAECLVGSSVSWSAQPPTLCSVFAKGELHSQPLVTLLCDSIQSQLIPTKECISQIFEGN